MISAEEVTSVHAETFTSVTDKDITTPAYDTHDVESVVQITISQGSSNCFAKQYARLQVYETSPPAAVYAINPVMSRGTTGAGYTYSIAIDGGTQIVFYSFFGLKKVVCLPFASRPKKNDIDFTFFRNYCLFGLT